MTRYHFLTKIGRGTYGAVFSGLDTAKTPPNPIVIKVMSMMNGSIPCYILREITALKTLNHPNIIRLLDVYFLKENACLVFEKMDRDLREHLRRNPDGIGIDLSRSYMLQLLQALSYTHSRGFLHRDLKPSNLLIDTEGIIKVADFGLSRESLYDGQHSPEMISYWYRPLELMLGYMDYSEPADMWGAGCIYIEMLTGKPPFTGDGVVSMIHEIIEKLGTPTSSDWPAVEQLPHYDLLPTANYPLRLISSIITLESEDAYLVDALLRLNPNDRMLAMEAMNLPLFDNYRL